VLSLDRVIRTDRTAGAYEQTIKNEQDPHRTYWDFLRLSPILHSLFFFYCGLPSRQVDKVLCHAPAMISRDTH
jgi:hypothetical protein